MKRIHSLCCSVLVAGSALLSPLRAHADAPAPLASTLQGEAKSDFEAGRLLANSGDFAGALLKFQSAYREAGDPRLLWNAAVCERNLRHYANAILLVRRFLASESPLITPEAAANARAFIDAAEPLTAPFSVESNAPDAQVYLDDERLGPPQLLSGVRIDLGTHRVVVEAPGFERYAQTVTVTGSAEVHVTAILRPDAVEMPVAPNTPVKAPPVPSSSASSLRSWLLVAGGCVVLAGAVTGGYFIFKPSAPPDPVPGSIATYRF